ncbi:hypothetical protein APR12_005227 [Nocardia amikacinitolerans]|nr:hypothetical protein [Nocardia amikacinitolerans]
MVERSRRAGARLAGTLDAGTRPAQLEEETVSERSERTKDTAPQAAMTAPSVSEVRA